MKLISFAFALASAAFGPNVSAATPSPRQPVKPWVVNYADTRCTATRIYGTAEAPMMFGLRPSPRGNVMQIMVARTGKAPAAYHIPITVGVGARALKTTALRLPSPDQKSDILWINFDRAQLDGLGLTEHIDVKSMGVIDESFAIPGIAAALKAIDTCNQDLQKYWNVGEGETTAVATHAQSVKPLNEYVSDTDFPAQATFEGLSGKTTVTLMVNEAGELKDCMVEESSGVGTLDGMTCAVLVQRAKFLPATNASGKPVRSVLRASIKWVSPNHPKHFVTSSRVPR